MSMQELPPLKTLNGKFCAYCHVCWLPIYRFWVDRESPEHDVCSEGAHHTAQTCPASAGQAGLTAWIKKLRDAGEIK
ncbi:hypothetical protein [Ancylobacter oerskovii]|uniref:Uncharacterized protein n=1 Tax=Ancylobacter oerskovii TaxID=459519 RepID=A0ABW4Z0X8_9HYPH|nr:hypothetical protein [Ancylobacter oerskovii]MBS7542561.1 hypothetical protein [Ancylobacter oerskovii]